MTSSVGIVNSHKVSIIIVDLGGWVVFVEQVSGQHVQQWHKNGVCNSIKIELLLL
jgi:hypothetical protein